MDNNIFYEKHAYISENQIEAEDSYLMGGLSFFIDEYSFHDVRKGGEKIKPMSVNSMKNTNMTNALL